MSYFGIFRDLLVFCPLDLIEHRAATIPEYVVLKCIADNFKFAIESVKLYHAAMMSHS